MEYSHFVSTHRQLALTVTELAHTRYNSIQLELLKIGAYVMRNTRAADKIIH